MTEMQFLPKKEPGETPYGWVDTIGTAVPAVDLLEHEEEQGEEWLTARRAGIGGSDAGAILGVDQWKGPYAVWLSKVEQLDSKAGDAAEWGHRLESVIADAYEEKNGAFAAKCRYILANNERDWQLANIDRAVILSNGRQRGLEIKTAGKRWWDGDCAPTWYTQIQHYMSVTGLDEWDLAVLIGGQNYEQHRIYRDEPFIEKMVEAETEFWDLVERKVEPTADYSKTTMQMLGSAHAMGSVELTPDVVEACRALELIKTDMKRMFARKAEVEGIIKTALGTASFGTFNGETVVRWPSHEVRRIESKAVKKNYPDIVDEVTKVSVERRLYIDLEEE